MAPSLEPISPGTFRSQFRLAPFRSRQWSQAQPSRQVAPPRSPPQPISPGTFLAAAGSARQWLQVWSQFRLAPFRHLSDPGSGRRRNLLGKWPRLEVLSRSRSLGTGSEAAPLFSNNQIAGLAPRRAREAFPRSPTANRVDQSLEGRSSSRFTAARQRFLLPFAPVDHPWIETSWTPSERSGVPAALSLTTAAERPSPLASPTFRELDPCCKLKSSG